jgi:hypothetical protein
MITTVEGLTVLGFSCGAIRFCYNRWMIFIDPYCITLIVTECIRLLFEAGHLAAIEPDEEYGYTCRTVFGVLPSEIAAIRDEDAGGRQLLWFHLNDGRVICGTPDALGYGARPRDTTIH